MKKLFKWFKALFAKNLSQGCSECDMPLEHLYTNKNEKVYTCYECNTFDLRDDSGEYPDNHWTNTERGY